MKRRSVVDFTTLLQGYDLADLEEHKGVIYGLWPDLRLAYVNPAWYRFATSNGGEPALATRWKLGVSILDAFAPVLRSYYEAAYRRCQDSGKRWEHEYECSSPDRYRRFRQIVYPLKQGGLLVVNALLVEEPHNRPAERPHEQVYRDAKGWLHQCVYCRRVSHQQIVHRWDWVPAWVAQIPAQTSHTYCPTCYGHYFS